MTCLQKIVALLFVALWLPTTIHCSLEKLPGLQFLECPSDNAGDCSNDGCQTIESGQYKVSDDTAILPVPVIGFVWVVLVDADLESEAGRDSAKFSCDRTQELPRRWQFIYRAATLVRAPSFLS